MLKKISNTKSEDTSFLDNPDYDHFVGISLLNGDDVYGYMTEADIINPTWIRLKHPLLARKVYSKAVAETMIFLFPWSIASNEEVFIFRKDALISIFPLKESIQKVHEKTWKTVYECFYKNDLITDDENEEESSAISLAEIKGKPEFLN